MSIIVDLIGELQEVIQEDHALSPEFLADTKGKVCHTRIVGAVKDAVKRLPGVTPSYSEKQLGKNPRRRPDVRLLASDGQCVGVVEYESSNSSDERVISKDEYGYEGWTETLPHPVPLLIITTLPNASMPKYQLRWTGCNRREGWSEYNTEHESRLSEIRQNPFLYWYGHYRRWLEHRITDLPLHFANFSGNQLSHVPRWPTSPLAYEPVFDDGSDWSGMFPHTPVELQALRKLYKKKLWAESDLVKLKALLAEYWSQEQEICGSERWNDKYFTLWLKRMRNREEACRWIENVQWARLY